MNKYKLIVLINPYWWIREGSTNKDLDKFYRYLLDHKNEVKVLGRGEYEMDLIFRGLVIRVWRTNFPYAYLTRTAVIEKDGRVTESSAVLPSRATALEFYETFDTPQEACSEAPETTLLKLIQLTEKANDRNNH